jgi:ParB-like chromosome segregation protein Spo0J
MRKPADPLVIEYVPPAALIPWPRNPRKITTEAKARLWRVLDRFGLVEPLVVRGETDHLLGGHQRRAWAMERKLEAVPVVRRYGYSDHEAEALNVALNNRDAAGEWDLRPLTEILSDLDAFGFDATVTGFDLPALGRLLTLTWTPDAPAPSAPKGGGTVSCPQCGHSFPARQPR